MTAHVLQFVELSDKDRRETSLLGKLGGSYWVPGGGGGSEGLYEGSGGGITEQARLGVRACEG
jgi:hypothetical protein